MKLRKEEIRPGSEALEGLRAAILREAHQLEIDALAFADPDCGPAAASLERWLQDGHHAGMGYMERHRDLRLDPRRFFPSVRSILCAAVSYHAGDEAPDPPGADPPALPRISRYARGADYHRVLKGKLKQLLATLTAWVPGLRGRVAVDTAPVMERHWAEQAGLGWIGKNCCLIAPGLGSWVFLGEIFLDVSLPAGEAAVSRCGTCMRCMEACPTGALVAPGRLDARRCIAYWTVEHRGPFPAEAPRLSPWLFGCDRCQEVCPWNRTVAATRVAAFRPTWPGAPRDLDAWRRLTPDAFEMHLKPTPIERCGYDGFMRNAHRLAAERDEAGGTLREP